MVAIKQNASAPDLLALEAKIDALGTRIEELVERQRRTEELISEAGPIVKDVLKVATEKLGTLESRGYFEFGKEALAIVDRVVTSYDAEDLRRLGDSVVGILDTVRNLTQPEVLAVANEATEALGRARSVKPVGLLGAARAASKDTDVQRGVAMTLEVLRHVGKAAQTFDRKERRPKRTRLEASTRPKRRDDAPPPVAPVPVAAAPAPIDFDGVAVDEAGHLLDPADWSRELAVRIAATVGVPELTETHWQVIDFCRAEFEATGKSPNIRRITQGTGLNTKDIYGLFPQAPGRAAARCAGLPKPVGCL
jgi:TusE/DsrC/DsvC family sulfur relay protein